MARGDGDKIIFEDDGGRKLDRGTIGNVSPGLGEQVVGKAGRDAGFTKEIAELGEMLFSGD